MKMAGKKEEKIIKYITALPAGARVSVRNIAKDLDVSEGTAYKAIKHAEELKLVDTKPRSGTVRLQQEMLFSDANAVTLASEIGRLGLVVLTGGEYADGSIGRIVLGDGSLEQFKTSLAAAGTPSLCLVGDRPDLLFHAAAQGKNIIVTNGVHPGEALLATAKDHCACVLSSQQDSGTVLELLRSGSDGSFHATNSDMADKWMRIPPYLYYNDMVVDWYNSYKSLYSLSSQCAVVDDELHVCGVVDAVQVLNASPSVKISKLFARNERPYCADMSTPMREIAQHMVSGETSVAYITNNGVLCGLITANDIIRYYQHNPAAGDSARIPALELMSSEAGRSVYTMQLDRDQFDAGDTLMNIANMAAKRFCAEHFSGGYAVTSGTFFTTEVPHGEIMVSCERQNTTPNGCALEIEMYDEAASYAKCVLIVTETAANR